MKMSHCLGCMFVASLFFVDHTFWRCCFMCPFEGLFNSGWCFWTATGWVLAMWRSCLLLLPVSMYLGLGNLQQRVGIGCFVLSMVSCKHCWFVLFLCWLIWSIVSDLSLCSPGILVACLLLFLPCLVHGLWCLGCLGGKWLCIPLQPFCECWVKTVVIVGWRPLGMLSMWVGQKVETFCLLFVISLRWVDKLFVVTFLQLVILILCWWNVKLPLSRSWFFSCGVSLVVLSTCLSSFLVCPVLLSLCLLPCVLLRLFCLCCLRVGPNSLLQSGRCDSFLLFYWVEPFPVAASLFLFGAPCTFRCSSRISRLLGGMMRSSPAFFFWFGWVFPLAVFTDWCIAVFVSFFCTILFLFVAVWVACLWLVVSLDKVKHFFHCFGCGFDESFHLACVCLS